ATHPLEPQTAFALFSMAGTPKIMKTSDLGASWEELSGFGANGESNNGFPDVAVYSLLVMPFDTDVLWAGTEIGIFESRNGGATWQLLEGDFPAVAVWQMRIVNDQVVIATHGRGVWTATLPELATYEPTDHTLSPELLALQGGANGQLNLQLVRRAQYDSTLVFVSGQRVARLDANIIRDTVDVFVDLQQLLDGVAETSLDVAAWSYVNGQAMPAPTQSMRIYATNPPVNALVTSFDDGSAAFFLEGFDITTATGFSSTALHSPHPYPDFLDARATLRTPIRVSATDAIVSYDEIAMVEAGKSEAAFGTPAFYDYVVLEGSLDSGITWTPIADGYDVRYTSLWEIQSDLMATPDELLMARHEVNLLDQFQEGDEVLLRFRMVTDNAVTGWGWVVDNLRIQSALPTGIDDDFLPDAFSLLPGYPNPFQTETVLTYTLPEPSAVTLTIYDVQGRQVQVLVQDPGQAAGKHTVRWDGKTTWGTPVASGIYFSRLEAGDTFGQTRQLVKVR
ncbi:MAG: T9SS type A sorting domain-containing protein, partial [Bacteroidota bacterium]